MSWRYQQLQPTGCGLEQARNRELNRTGTGHYQAISERIRQRTGGRKRGRRPGAAGLQGAAGAPEGDGIHTCQIAARTPSTACWGRRRASPGSLPIMTAFPPDPRKGARRADRLEALAGAHPPRLCRRRARGGRLEPRPGPGRDPCPAAGRLPDACGRTPPVRLSAAAGRAGRDPRLWRNDPGAAPAAQKGRGAQAEVLQHARRSDDALICRPAHGQRGRGLRRPHRAAARAGRERRTPLRSARFRFQPLSPPRGRDRRRPAGPRSLRPDRGRRGRQDGRGRGCRRPPVGLEL